MQHQLKGADFGPDARTEDFFTKIPAFEAFDRLMDPTLYRPLPEGWSIGIADIVNSTAAITSERYRAVNMAGAAVIAAVTNALQGSEFPFAFGGDGASLAVSAGQLAPARQALVATASWVARELDLRMRTGLVPIADIRAEGHDVLVARYLPSESASYAMFTGGGLAWAESQLKKGRFAIAPELGAFPDLTGLSCRFDEMKAVRGLILSVIAVPAPGAEPGVFRRTIEDIIRLVEASPDAGRPISSDGLVLGWPPAGLDLEARARSGGSLALRRAKLLSATLAHHMLTKFGIGKGRAKRYAHAIVENSDFRKYDDGLRMVLDCDESLDRALRQRLDRGKSDGILRYGLHRQDAAMITCFTASAWRTDHVHFIDGARGGYASAATALKRGSC